MEESIVTKLTEEEKSFLLGMKNLHDPEPEISIDDSTGFVTITFKGPTTRVSVFFDVKRKKIIETIQNITALGLILAIFFFPIVLLVYMFRSSSEKAAAAEVAEECIRRYSARFPR